MKGGQVDKLYQLNLTCARSRWGRGVDRAAREALRTHSEQFHFSIARGDLLFLNESWYVTHAGLVGLARRNRCVGIHVRPVPAFCDPSAQRWAFQATVYKSR